MERGVNKKTYYNSNISGVRSSSTTPHLPEKMGQTGEGQVQWETLGRGLTMTTYIGVSVTTADAGSTTVDIEIVVALRVIRSRRPVIVAIFLP